MSMSVRTSPAAGTESVRTQRAALTAEGVQLDTDWRYKTVFLSIRVWLISITAIVWEQTVSVCLALNSDVR